MTAGPVLSERADTGAGPAGPARPTGAAPAGPARVGAPVGVRLSGVTVGYRRREPVVRAVSLEVPPGSWLALIGPNGAGKSTLLKAVAGLVPHQGTVSLGGGPEPGRPGRPGGGRTRQRRERALLAAYLPQHPELPPGMTVAEYVLLGRTAHLRWLGAEGAADRRIVQDVVDRLDLGPYAGRPLDELSGGEVQRVVLARALAQQSPVLLLDEPTSALDIGHGLAVLELVDELRHEAGLTVISAMHDLGSAGRFADQLALIDRGDLVAAGPPPAVLTEAILSRYYHTPVQVLTGADGAAVIVPLRLRGAPARPAVPPTDQEPPHQETTRR